MRNWINLITEAFSSPVAWKWEDIDHEYALAKFEINDATYCFIGRAKNNAWGITFGNLVGSTKFSVTPTGDNVPFAVFSTVVEITKDLFQRYHPREIYFSTPRHDGTSRASVYTRLAKQLAAQYGGQVSIGDFDDDDTIQFRVRFS